MRISARTSHSHKVILTWVIVITLIAGGIGTTQWFDPAMGDLFPFIPLLVAMGVGLCLPRRCQHLEWSMLLGAILGAGAFALPILGRELVTGNGAGILQLRFAVPFASGSFLCAVMGGTALTVWTWVYRSLFRRSLVADGTLCPTCGYCILHLPTHVCPECGNAFDDLPNTVTMDRNGHRSGRVVRRRRSVFLVVGVYATAALLFFNTNRPWFVLTRPDYWSYVSTRPSDVVSFHHLLGDLVHISNLALQISPSEFRSIVGEPAWYLTDDRGTFYIYKEGTNGSRITYVDFPGNVLRDGEPNADPNRIHPSYRRFSETSEEKGSEAK